MLILGTLLHLSYCSSANRYCNASNNHSTGDSSLVGFLWQAPLPRYFLFNDCPFLGLSYIGWNHEGLSKFTAIRAMGSANLLGVETALGAGLASDLFGPAYWRDFHTDVRTKTLHTVPFCLHDYFSLTFLMTRFFDVEFGPAPTVPQVSTDSAATSSRPQRPRGVAVKASKPQKPRTSSFATRETNEKVNKWNTNVPLITPYGPIINASRIQRHHLDQPNPVHPYSEGHDQLSSILRESNDTPRSKSTSNHLRIKSELEGPCVPLEGKSLDRPVDKKQISYQSISLLSSLANDSCPALSPLHISSLSLEAFLPVYERYTSQDSPPRSIQPTIQHNHRKTQQKDDRLALNDSGGALRTSIPSMSISQPHSCLSESSNHLAERLVSEGEVWLIAYNNPSGTSSQDANSRPNTSFNLSPTSSTTLSRPPPQVYAYRASCKERLICEINSWKRAPLERVFTEQLSFRCDDEEKPIRAPSVEHVKEEIKLLERASVRAVCTDYRDFQVHGIPEWYAYDRLKCWIFLNQHVYGDPWPGNHVPLITEREVEEIKQQAFQYAESLYSTVTGEGGDDGMSEGS